MTEVDSVTHNNELVVRDPSGDDAAASRTSICHEREPVQTGTELAKRNEAQIERSDVASDDWGSSNKVVRININRDSTGKFKELGGSLSDDVNVNLIQQALTSLPFDTAEPEKVQRLGQALVGTLKSIAPRDEIEAMIVVQMFMVHDAMMECLRQAHIKDQTIAIWRESLNQANKLSRTYTTLVESFNRHRGKSQQRVVVEHVHINDGGQAIVGPVTHQTGNA